MTWTSALLGLAGLLLGYAVKFAQDWLHEARADRHRWKARRLDVLLEALDTLSGLRHLAYRHRHKGSAAWQHPGFADDVLGFLKDLERLHLQLMLLFADRDTFRTWKLARAGVIGCLPPTETATTWDVKEALDHAQEAIDEFVGLARVRELGQLPIGIIVATGPDSGWWKRQRGRFQLWQKTMRKG